MAEEDQDKTEDATPFKLQEAKKRGQVAKSLEFNSMMVILALLFVSALWAKGMIISLLELNRSIFSNAHTIKFDIPSFILWLEHIFTGLLFILAPIFTVLVIISVLMNIFQTGPVFSVYPIKPDFKKLNPVTGFKRVFSKKMLFEAFKSLVKLGFFGTILYMVIRSIIPDISRLLTSDPDSYVASLLSLSIQLIMTMLAAIMFIALLDMIYTRWEFSKKMMMSRRELKDEHKRREGDPHVRNKMKEVQREAAKRTDSIKRVPEADVLITNPTHFAVAVLYDKSKMKAPIVIAKGAGSLAKKIKYFAAKNNVPTIENKKLARLLFKESDIDGPVPESVFAEMAKILVWAYTRKGKLTAHGIVKS